MRKVKFVKAIPGYLEGSIAEFDENSAAKLIERGDAEAYEGPESSTPVAGSGNVQVVQVREADIPDAPAPAEPESTELTPIPVEGQVPQSGPDGAIDPGAGTPPQGTEFKPGETATLDTTQTPPTSPEITSADVSSKVTASRGAGGGGGTGKASGSAAGKSAAE